MPQKIVKIFDDLEPFETRFEGTFSFDAEKNAMVYDGRGIIFDDKILYSVSFLRKKVDNKTYSDTPSNISGNLEFNGERYILQNILFDKKADEFLFTFTNGEKVIKLDCEITDFKFRCDYFMK